MVDHAAIQFGLFAHAATLSVCTTGSATLAATTTGFTRSTGSFLSDGFKIGMEVVPSGFTQTDPGIITDVTDTVLTIAGGRSAQSAGSGRSLSVGLPALIAYENAQFTPVDGRPYLSERLVPATQQLKTAVRSGYVESTGLYVLTWFGLANAGTAALHACLDALLALFPPGWSVTLADGSVLRIRGDVGPTRGQSLRIDGGWTAVTVSLPYRLLSLNPS